MKAKQRTLEARGLRRPRGLSSGLPRAPEMCPALRGDARQRGGGRLVTGVLCSSVPRPRLAVHPAQALCPGPCLASASVPPGCPLVV